MRTPNVQKSANRPFSQEKEYSGLLSPPSSLKEQRKILEKVFSDLGLPQVNQSFLTSYKIPKRKMNFLYAPLFNPDALRESIVKPASVGPQLCYNLPPPLHWNLICGWPWPRPVKLSDEVTPSSSSSSYGHKTISPVDAVVNFIKSDDWKDQLLRYEEQKKRDKERRCKPRFRFDSDRNHDFSDNEDVSTIPSKVKSIKSQSSYVEPEPDSGNGPSPDSSEENNKSSPSPTQPQECFFSDGNRDEDEGIGVEDSPKKLVWKMKFDLKARAIVHSEFHNEKFNAAPSPTKVKVKDEVVEPVESVVVCHEEDYNNHDVKLFGPNCNDDDDSEDILTISIEDDEREF